MPRQSARWFTGGPVVHGRSAVSGLDTLRLARRTRPDLKVLFASGYADLSRFGANLASHSLLKKPFKLETLAEAVQTALQRVTS